MRSAIRDKLKFAASSSIATATDYILYILLVGHFFTPVVSNMISYSCAVILNFTLQNQFIFINQRKLHHTFIWSMSFSLIGLILSTLLIWLLNHFAYLASNQYLTKIIVTGIIFFYNFYSKRYAFEKRFSGNSNKK